MNDSSKATDRLLAIARSLQHPEQNYGLPEEFSPTLPSYADIVVIGSGITGCSVSKALLEDDSLESTTRIVVLEARTLASNATGRNGSQLVSPVGHLYNTMCKRHSEETAKEMGRFSFMNIERIMGMLEELDPELQESSEIRHVHKVMVAGDEETWKTSKESLNSFREAIPSYQTTHRVTEQDNLAKDFNIKNGHGVIDHPAGAVWPYRPITGIFERLLVQYHDRLSIETNTPATAIKYISGTASDGSSMPDYPYVIETPRGAIQAKQSTLDPVSERFDGGLYYLQQHATTGDIWVGTDYSNIFDVLTSDDTAVPGHSVEALLKFLPKYFVKGWPEDERPELKGVWTGLQGHTSDGLPLVGKLLNRGIGALYASKAGQGVII
nr:hypothetical protein FVER53263_08504 [Fusarium verticillioides]